MKIFATIHIFLFLLSVSAQDITACDGIHKELPGGATLYELGDKRKRGKSLTVMSLSNLSQRMVSRTLE
jgi:hypothetical protein